jgi:hypothetical protein
LVVDGIAGVGKTNLICDLLWSRSDVCGHYFKNIVWLVDRNADQANVASIGLDALLLLNAIPFDFSANQPDSPHSLHDELRSYQRPQTMRIRLSKVLADKPKTLIIIDDVLLPETIDLFRDLKVSPTLLTEYPVFSAQ